MEIIGHKQIIQFLKVSAAHSKLSHAYLFYGPRHIGKSTVAKYFACHLLCGKKSKHAFACGKCDHCIQILKQIHPDIYYIASKDQKISIERIRDLTRMFSQEPLAGSYKVAIIEDAHNLTIAAANSFLKFLEEAPKNTIIILISPSFSGLLETVRSRCQILRFCSPVKSEIAAFLKDKFDLTTSDVLAILRLSQGKPGLAIEFAQNPDSLAEYKKVMNAFVYSFEKNNMEAKLRLVPLILDSNINALALLLGFVQNLIHVKLGLVSKMDDKNATLQSVAQMYALERMVSMAYNILQTQQYIRYNVNKRLALENLLINI